MDGWLKLLIAVACVVAIAAGGLYFYRDRQAAEAAEAAEKDRVMRSGCRQAAEKPKQLVELHAYCVEKGYIRK